MGYPRGKINRCQVSSHAMWGCLNYSNKHETWPLMDLILLGNHVTEATSTLVAMGINHEGSDFG